ncbi:UNKNOWN [Stylonychia lemnae]|uniref:Uncharacterized protein n=1 Tax=Stylonychia lemnae TaxID=5949 RepID=A0A078A793_STYLE|nr:UNKNOWN [Stylonychia lemnae]|eukprot:CDW78119.1 UNKNOWN [Stylonychia lemnae]
MSNKLGNFEVPENLTEVKQLNDQILEMIEQNQGKSQKSQKNQKRWTIIRQGLQHTLSTDPDNIKSNDQDNTSQLQSNFDEGKIITDIKVKLANYIQTQHEEKFQQMIGNLSTNIMNESRTTFNGSTRSLRSTQINMLFDQSKELLKRKCDKFKNQLQAKKELLKNYEAELEKLRSANQVNVNISSSSNNSLNVTSLILNSQFHSSLIGNGDNQSPNKLMNSTIITSNESILDYTNLSSLSGRLDILKMKLVHIAERSLEAYRENTVLKSMLRKSRLQRECDRKDRIRIGDSLAAVEKIVYSIENIKYLDSGRKISVDGMNQSHRFIFNKDRDKMQQMLTRCNERLKIEEEQTQEMLHKYLQHLRKVKIFQQDLIHMRILKKQQDSQQKQLTLIMRNRRQEYLVLRNIYGIHHLKRIIEMKQNLQYSNEFEFEQQMQEQIKMYQFQMLQCKIISYESVNSQPSIIAMGQRSGEQSPTLQSFNNQTAFDQYLMFRNFFQETYQNGGSELKASKPVNMSFDYVLENYQKVFIRQQFLNNRIHHTQQEKQLCRIQLINSKILMFKLQQNLREQQEHNLDNDKDKSDSQNMLKEKLAKIIQSKALNVEQIAEKIKQMAGILMFFERTLMYLTQRTVGPYVTHIQTLVTQVKIDKDLIATIEKYKNQDNSKIKLFSSKDKLNIFAIRLQIDQQFLQIFFEYKEDIIQMIHQLENLNKQIEDIRQITYPRKKNLTIKNALAEFKKYFISLNQNVNENFNIEQLEEIKNAVMEMLEDTNETEEGDDYGDEGIQEKFKTPELLDRVSYKYQNSQINTDDQNLTIIDESNFKDNDSETQEFNRQLRKTQQNGSQIGKAMKERRRNKQMYQSVEVTDEIRIMKQKNRLVNFEREELKFMSNLKSKIKKDYDRIKYEIPLQQVPSPTLEKRLLMSQVKPKCDHPTERQSISTRRDIQSSRRVQQPTQHSTNQTAVSTRTKHRTDDLDQFPSIISDVNSLSRKQNNPVYSSRYLSQKQDQTLNKIPSVSQINSTPNQSQKNLVIGQVQKFVNEKSLRYMRQYKFEGQQMKNQRRINISNSIVNPKLNQIDTRNEQKSSNRNSVNLRESNPTSVKNATSEALRVYLQKQKRIKRRNIEGGYNMIHSDNSLVNIQLNYPQMFQTQDTKSQVIYHLDNSIDSQSLILASSYNNQSVNSDGILPQLPK